MLVSVDTGKYGTKAVKKRDDGTFRKFYFRTRVEPLSVASYSNGKERTYVLEYGGREYRIGEESLGMELDTSKTTMSHKLAILLALGRLCSQEDGNVHLITGCPLSVFNNQAKKEEHKKFILEGSPFTIRIDGERREVAIGDLTLLPESLGIPYKNVDENMEKLIGVVDIGGLNTNCAIYKRLKPIRTTAFTINQGTMILMNRIKHALNTALEGTNYQDYEIPYLVRNPGYIKNPIIQEIIDDVLEQHIIGIGDEMKQRNWNIQGLEIHFTGGGSTDLRSAIEKFMPDSHISNDGVWDNVNAFYRVGEMLGIG